MRSGTERAHLAITSRTRPATPPSAAVLRELRWKQRRAPRRTATGRGATPNVFGCCPGSSLGCSAARGFVRLARR
eukprot:3039572-Pleurochrysis_carterae.AAC.2